MTKSTKRNIVSACIIVILISCALLVKFSEHQYYQKDYDKIEPEKVLYVVTDYDPIGYFVSGDSIAGYNYELLKAIQKYSNIKFEISVENNLEKSFQGLEKGKYDLIARNIPINSNLYGDSLKFTDPIIQNLLILIQRKAEYNKGKEPIRNQLYLAKKSIYIPRGSSSIIRLENLSEEIGDTIKIIQDSIYGTSQLAMMVASGDIDFTVSDQRSAEVLAKEMPELDIRTNVGFTHLEGWVVRSSSPILLDSLNAWINRFKETTDYTSLYNKYYK